MLEIYQNEEDNQWYWKLQAGSNETVAASIEGFPSRGACVSNLLMTHSMIGTLLARLAKESLGNE